MNDCRKTEEPVKRLGNRKRFFFLNTNTAGMIISANYLFDKEHLSLELGMSEKEHMVSNKTHTEQLIMFIFKVLNFSALLLQIYSKHITKHGNLYY